MNDLNGFALSAAPLLDGKAAEKPLHKVASEDLVLSFEPVAILDARSSRSLHPVAYNVCLPGFYEPDVAAQKAGSFIRYLEEKDLASQFDRLILSKIAKILETGMCTVVGCTVSAGSLLPNRWWQSFLKRLDRHPEIASRLVIEIADTKPMVDFAATLSLLKSLRQVGCRIAIDNFGAGHSSCRAMMAVNADLIKIEQSFLWSADEGIATRDTFGHLVGLARSMAASVVAKGIETEEHLEMSIAAGATHGQGRLIGCPSLSRPFEPYASRRTSLTYHRLTKQAWQNQTPKQSAGSDIHSYHPAKLQGSRR